jgi:anaerobic selenocysteine-containing dehydrogenase
MEIKRRNFIQLLAGGVAGIHLTPLPWKLMDDISIWTQNNWPWVPKPQEGPFTHEKTVCTLCPGGCGIEVRKVSGRPVKIEGRTDYPVNPGGICPLGAGGLQLLYNETIRVTAPMKRVGPRGANQFQPISWTEALSILAERISNLRKEGRPEALAALDGSGRGSAQGALVQRLLESVGSPNYFRSPTIEDTYDTANLLMLGVPGPMAYDLENADYILSVGPALIEGWGAPGRVIAAWGQWHAPESGKGPKVVQVESRASRTASKADGWLAPRPGTESALALGLAHVMIREKLVDPSFLSNYTHGYEDWVDDEGRERKGFRSMVLDAYAPAKVEEITGVSADRIVATAREFGKAKSPLAVYGKGKGNLNGSLLECMAVQSLNALKGNINKPGGMIVQEGLPVAPWPEVTPDAVARRGLDTGRLNGAGLPDLPLNASLVEHLSRAVLEGKDSPVDTLLVFSANPAYTLPDGGAFEKALKKIPFIVSFSPFQDETGSMADLILPDHTNLEKLEDVVWPTGLQFPFLGLSTPVIRPLYKTRHSGDTVIALAGKIGDPVAAAFPWDGFEEALKERLRGLADSRGLTSWDPSKPVWETFAQGRGVSSDYESFDDLWEQLESNGFWYKPTHAFYTWLTCFRTPSGKFEFASERLARAVRGVGGGDERDAFRKLDVEAAGDEAYLPHYEKSLSGEFDEESLTLVPYELINVSTDWLPNPPFLTKTLFDTQLRKEDSFAKVNPATAERLGLRQGERIVIQSEAGEIPARVDLFEGAMPGCVYLLMGFGHKAYGIYQKDKGVNPMSVMAGSKDPLSGQYIWWNTPVRVRKA